VWRRACWATLRIRLFAHLLRLPASYGDRVPIGDVTSRCTADVETLDTVFSSGVALLLAHLVRLVTIAGAMALMSPGLSLVAALVAAPLVLITRVLQVRVRQAERQTRVAIGAVLDAGRVIVLDQGRVAEEGAPAALIARDGRFAAWLDLETAGGDWERA
jgi:ABC-type multidrug transport system fused ATPase/permease subunit